MITPMLLCIIAIGTADVMFAVDSIPVIYSLTAEPYLVFAAIAFSLLGLRQLYFLIDGLLGRLVYLPYGLAVILGFIGLPFQCIFFLCRKLKSHVNLEPYLQLRHLPQPNRRVSLLRFFL